MPFQITEPGIFLDVPSADYFADPCPEPSLTQSTAKILLDRSPRHAWKYHPRLNPAWEPSENKKFAIGNAAHSLMLGRGKELSVIAADDWRTKAAKELRDEAIDAGKVPILQHQYDAAWEMVQAARPQLSGNPDTERAFIEGNGEVVIAAPIGGIWLRSMIDWTTDPRHIYDYKTTGLSASPDRIPYIMADAGWDMQAAVQERILDFLDPEGVGRRHHYFVCQETDDPYALTPCELPESVLQLGRRKLDAAITIWSKCLAANHWPMYATATVRPQYPTYAEAKWIERLVSEEQGEME